MASIVTADQINQFFAAAFSNRDEPPGISVEDVEDGYARVRLTYKDVYLRPGGVISGPMQMSMADTAMYCAIFTKIGIVPSAVTSNLNISFLNPCKAGDVIATGRILKIGKRTAVGEVDIREETMESPASHAMVSFALPNST